MKESKSKMSELRDKFTAARRAGKEACAQWFGTPILFDY